MLIGANNVRTFKDDYEELVANIIDYVPESNLFLISITPTCGAYQGYMPSIKEDNEYIIEIAGKYDASYIDLYSELLDESTGLLNEEYTIEGQHFNENGYIKITSVLSKYLD